MFNESEWVEFACLDTDGRHSTSACYVHKLAAVAVLPNFGPAGGTLLTLASGNQIRVKESVKDVMTKLIDKEGKHG